MMDPCRANSSSWEYQQQAIDAEIKSLEDSIRALKHRRNALAPISSLPTEVFAVIFSYLRLPSPSPFSSLPTGLTTDLLSYLPLSGTRPFDRRPDHDPWDWLRAAHVCHEWREIALDDPIFWSHVDFTIFPGVAEILARAKIMPLYLEASDASRFWGDDAWRHAFEKELQAHVSNICHLSITGESSNLCRTFDGLASPAPTLEYLSLSQAPPAQGFISSQVPVPDTLLGGTAPRLSCLELHDCTISWNSPLLKGLRYLEIRTSSANARPSLGVWLDTLDEMPQLTRLVLHEASPRAPPFPFDIERAVTLPSLTHLDISASVRECALALAHLTLPALSRLCLTVETRYTSGYEVQNMFPYVARHSDGPQDTQPLQSVLIYHQWPLTTILAWPVPDMNIDVHDPAFTFVSTVLSARVALFITNRDLAYSTYPQYQQRFLIDAAMNALPLDNLVMLAVQDSTPLSAQFWLSHAPKWPLLQRVRLAPLLVSEFREMLLQDNGSREYPLLPSLIELALIEVSLGERRTLRLCDALMRRVEQGVPLETLDLRTCRATSHAVRLLSEIVVDVREPFVMSPAPWEYVLCGSFVLDDSSAAEGHDDDEMVLKKKKKKKKLVMWKGLLKK